ncbi:MAG TPA: PEP-CTERM sorting domain-containing protein [Sedimentisphaerales bacterium]|nr:PEP-CTERM sorting domain-containing protein [Sedimentisphaerales bacterium]
MKKQLILVLAVVVFFVFSPWACKLAFGAYLYGISYDFSNPQIPKGVPYLCRIDPTEGSYVSVSQTPSIHGLSYNNSDGYLYGMGSNSHGLFRIDPADGSYDVISVPGVPEVTSGLAYNTSDGHLYGTGQAEVIPWPGNGDLFSIDLTDGSYDFVSTSPGYVMGLTYNSSDGYLYGLSVLSQPYIVRIDPADGSFTQVSAAPMGILYGLTFNSSDGYLYGISMTPNGSLYRIDPGNGSYVLVSDNSAPNVTALAYVPEPATFLLFGFAAILLRKKR